MKKVYIARMNADLTEGRGGTRNVAYFTNLQDAESVNATLEGVMGSKNEIPVDVITVYDSKSEYLDDIYGSIRKTALAKLTNVEKKALGL